MEEGPLRVGEEVSIDGGATVRVDGIEAFRKTLAEANAGDNVGVLFSKLQREDAAKGAVLTTAGAASGWTPAEAPAPPTTATPNPFGDPET